MMNMLVISERPVEYDGVDPGLVSVLVIDVDVENDCFAGQCCLYEPWPL